jgi:toxin-antitoxin system PIN domain toxin
MAIFLPDVNVWLALIAEGHRHHAVARTWFSQQTGDSVAFCRITHVGLLRLLTNPHVVPLATAIIQLAWDRIEQLRTDRRVVFSPETQAIEPIWRDLMTRRGVGPSAWTDAYLAAFAMCHGHSLVTFDTDFHRWPMLDTILLRG